MNRIVRAGHAEILGLVTLRIGNQILDLDLEEASFLLESLQQVLAVAKAAEEAADLHDEFLP